MAAKNTASKEEPKTPLQQNQEQQVPVIESKVEFAPLAQMTLKGIGCKPLEAVKKSAVVFMARIFGEVSDVKTKEARNGDAYSYFVGEFRAIGPDEKTKFESGKLFLPGGLFETIEGEFKAGGGKAVQFGYDIYSTPDDKSSTGYRYAARTIIKTASSDRLKAMTEALSANPIKSQV